MYNGSTALITIQKETTVIKASSSKQNKDTGTDHQRFISLMMTEKLMIIFFVFSCTVCCTV